MHHETIHFDLRDGKFGNMTHYNFNVLCILLFSTKHILSIKSKYLFSETRKSGPRNCDEIVIKQK